MATITPKKFDCVRERLIQYIRYQRQEHGISTEYSLNMGRHANFSADVLSRDQYGRITEWEIKKSWSDFMKDFDKTARDFEDEYDSSLPFKTKHQRVVEGRGANKFYFVFPDYEEKLIKKASDYLKKNFPKYGVVAVHRLSHCGCSVVKPGRIIHKKKLDLTLGGGSSLASMARKVLRYEEKLKEERGRNEISGLHKEKRMD